MDDYLSKPVRSESLRLTLERWITPAGSGEGAKVGEGSKKSHEPTRGVLDQARLAIVRQAFEPGAADALAEVIDLYLDEAASQLKGVDEALTREDVADVKRLTHRLRGSSAVMGATRMAALCGELESHDQGQDGRALLGQLEVELGLVREALGAERNKTWQ